jgi:hypothetical protein
MEKYYRRAGSKNLVRDLCVAAFEVDHLAEFWQIQKWRTKKILNRKGRREERKLAKKARKEEPAKKTDKHFRQ